MRDGLSVAGLILSIILLILGIIVVGKGFPFNIFGSPAFVSLQLLGEKLSDSLWGLRVLDVIVLSLIFFFSAIGCIALFRLEGRE